MGCAGVGWEVWLDGMEVTPIYLLPSRWRVANEPSGRRSYLWT